MKNPIFLLLTLSLALSACGTNANTTKSEVSTTSIMETATTQSDTSEASEEIKSDNASNTNNDAATLFAGGSGTKSEPYQIATTEQLIVICPKRK